MTKRLVSFSSILLLLVILGKFYAKPLLAQVRAAVVADMDTSGRAPYQRWLAFTCPAGTDRCAASGAQVPAGKRLAITNINGAFDLRSQVGQVIVVLLEHGSATFPTPPLPRLSLPVVFQGTASNLDTFVVNAPVLAYFDQADYPVIVVGLAAGNTTGHEMNFALSGYLVDCSAAPCGAISF